MTQKHSDDDESFAMMSKFSDDALRQLMQKAADHKICPHCIMRYLAAMVMVQIFGQERVLNNVIGQAVIGGELVDAASVLAELMVAMPKHVTRETFKPKPRH